jgi:hypothetical protein
VAVSDGVGCRVDLVQGKNTGEIFEDSNAQELGRIFQTWLHQPENRSAQANEAKSLIQSYSSPKAADGIFTALKAQKQ